MQRKYGILEWIVVLVLAGALGYLKKDSWGPVKTFLLAFFGLLLLVVIYRYIMVLNVEGYNFHQSATISQWIGANTNYEKLSLEFILGYTFAPLMWLRIRH